MATYDFTSKATVGVGANVIADFPTRFHRNTMYVLDKTLDIAKLTTAGYTMAAGDVFQLLQIPADSFVLAAGVEVLTAFDGTTPTVDVDFAGGDDIVDGGDVTATGWLAGGLNGQGLVVGGAAANAFTQLISATDTIDVTLNAGAADVTTGKLRVVAIVVSLDEKGKYAPAIATRDTQA